MDDEASNHRTNTQLVPSTKRKRPSADEASHPTPYARIITEAQEELYWNREPSKILDHAKQQVNRRLHDAYSVTTTTQYTVTREDVYKAHAALFKKLHDDKVDPSTLPLHCITSSEFRLLTMEDKRSVRLAARCVARSLLPRFPDNTPDQQQSRRSFNSSHLTYSSNIWFDEIPGEAQTLADEAEDQAIRARMQLLAHKSYSMLSYYEEKEKRQFERLQLAFDRLSAAALQHICPGTIISHSLSLSLKNEFQAFKRTIRNTKGGA